MAAVHARRQIRDAVAALLANRPTTGANVFSGRAHDLVEGEIPGLIITTAAAEGERAEVSSFGSTVKLDRSVRIAVIGYAVEGKDTENVLDQIALEVEQAIAAAQDDTASLLMSLIKDVRLATTQLGIASENNKRAGQVRLVYEFDYRTTRAAPQTAIA